MNTFASRIIIQSQQSQQTNSKTKIMGSNQKYQPPPFGVYTPLVTFFNEDETLDLDAIKKHALRMAEGGVVGVVIQGSNGEAPHLLHEERQTIVREVRATLHDAGFTRLKLIVGCGAPSVRETLLHMKEAQAAGADYGLVLPPAYWSAAMSVPVVERFFSDVASATTLPFLIYNFPGVTSGIDISSDTVIRLAQKHSNIVGAKLTCGSVGKLQRIASALSPESFSTIAGKSDFFLPALVAGSSGVIAALANVVPKLHVQILALYEAGQLKEAIALQSKLSNADWALMKLGVAGVKASAEKYFGYGSSRSRRPLGETDVSQLSGNTAKDIEIVVKLEKVL